MDHNWVDRMLTFVIIDLTILAYFEKVLLRVGGQLHAAAITLGSYLPFFCDVITKRTT